MASGAVSADSSRGRGGLSVRLPTAPPLKLLAGQLRHCARGGPGAWHLAREPAGRAPLELAAVWMQGRVLEAAEQGGWARLRDSSGSFTVRGLERVPQGKPCLAPVCPVSGLGLSGRWQHISFVQFGPEWCCLPSFFWHCQRKIGFVLCGSVRKVYPTPAKMKIVPSAESTGKYVMVMGVIQTCNPEPCLQAVKMTDLSENPIHESMWELEVEDLHRNIP